MSTPKISVIVPIYNVEPYLRKCLDSIVGQTCRNLEIILVDDGSSDNCGAICDEYAAQDSRVRVIHKANGGVASARNAGLAVASGNWIGWVDSDDWIEADMFEYLLSNALEADADIAVCGRSEVYPDKEIPWDWEEDMLLDREGALAQLLDPENSMMQNYCCDKLFRASLWKDIVFPEGRTFEDMAVMYRLFERADKVICLSAHKYNYLQHSESIVADTSIENKLNYYYASKERYEAARKHWPQFEDYLLVQCVTSAIGMWACYCANPRGTRRNAYTELQKVSAFCTPHVKRTGEVMGFGLAGKLVLRLIPYTTWWSFALAGLVNWLYEKKHGRPL